METQKLRGPKLRSPFAGKSFVKNLLNRGFLANGYKAAASSGVSKLAPTRDERLFLVLSIFIGVISGLLVVSFNIAIEWIKILTLGSAPHAGQYRLIFVPALGGILAAVLVYFFPGSRGSGVNQTKAALYVYNGYISFRTVIG